jgi:membrane-bound serine protease (ClpP class)
MALAGWGGLAHPAAAQSNREVLVLTLGGPLTAPMLTYLQRGLARAEREGAALMILQLNTPGGQINLMEDIVGAIRNSPLPVVVYVTPRGAIAGSAGTLITLAGHASAMAPETAIGAASPVGGQGEDLGETLEAKEKEALRALARSLAARRSPEAIALAEATIESAKAVTAEEALEAGLVDFIAADLPDLLQQLEGFSVEVNGQPRTLATIGLTVTEESMNLLETILSLLTNPNVVFVLLSLGSLFIWVEVSAPGGWVAGFLGVVFLVLSFYGLGVLPVNWFGIIFIVIAFVLFLMEVNATTHGALAAAGAGSLIVGALVLFNSPGSPEFFRVNVPLVVGTALVIAAAFIALVTFALRAQRRPVVAGVETLIGQEGEVRTPESVQVAGELWSAQPESGILEAGQKVIVIAVKGLKVLVRRK